MSKILHFYRSRPFFLRTGREQLAEARAFVQLLNTNEAEALAQEAQRRKESKPYAWVFEDELPMKTYIWHYVLGFPLVFISIFTTPIVPWAGAIGFASYLAFATVLTCILRWMQSKEACGRWATRNWDTPLSTAKKCLLLDVMIRENPTANLIEAQNRQLYVADLELASVLLRKHTIEADKQKKLDDEREACTRVHGAVSPGVVPA